MPRPVSDQVVVLMGASSGIGRATALAFAARGARVVCAGRTERALGTLVDEITNTGGTALAMPTDIADPAAVRALVQAAETEFGRIDTWVNLAGVSVFGRVEDITDEEFDRVLRVNFLGHVHGVRAVLPALRRAGGGSVIGVASVEGVRAVPLHAPYTASKFALRGFYDCLRIELAQEGARSPSPPSCPGPSTRRSSSTRAASSARCRNPRRRCTRRRRSPTRSSSPRRTRAAKSPSAAPRPASSSGNGSPPR
ncbi:SDR family NAD(P)-dependent oxidoreductase [Amycolatopsis sp. MtRt-6]|uniref:SDR family NAD(P)-dependent oxidoreductase n=1 Tax=Amycolatopsis sp. MtRt-6 TaxID=2792782 RepID=UPI001F5C961E|nr:SDR family NAD(P)-dependent oxidoreductase [Amycolatopsis sp. MtRt-6]